MISDHLIRTKVPWQRRKCKRCSCKMWGVGIYDSVLSTEVIGGCLKLLVQQYELKFPGKGTNGKVILVQCGVLASTDFITQYGVLNSLRAE